MTRALLPSRLPVTRRVPGRHLRPDVHAFVEPQVDVVDVRHPLAQRRREIEVRLQPLDELLVADAHQRGVALEHHDGVAGSVTSICDSRPGELGSRLQRGEQRPASAARASSIDAPVVAWRRREAVDDRQVELGVVRARTRR